MVVHGGINIAPEGQIINTGGGDVSIAGEGPRKRQRRESTPALDEDSQDEEGNGVEEDNEEDGTEEGSNNGDNGSSTAATPPPYNHPLHAFLVAFSAMKHKHQFVSGHILEDIIHTRVTQDPSSAGDAIYWIIDPSSSIVRSWFSNKELSELLGWVPSTPNVDEYFTYARKRYDNVSTRAPF